jgi:hypothetical protein
MNNTKYIIGVYDDEDTLKGGIKAIQKEGLNIHDVFTPYPVHGLHHLLHIPRSRLPKVAFGFGLVGAASGVALIAYTLGIDWPMDIGGKPHFPWPNYVPVTFELTVLLGALGMAFAYFYVNGMYPGAHPKIFDSRSTNDRFVMAIETSDATNEKLNNLLKETGVVEIKYTEDEN